MNPLPRILSAEGPGWNAARVAIAYVAVAAIPLFFGVGYHLNILNYIAVIALPALGLSLLAGLCGQLAISHGAFFAIGAYGSSILSVKAGWDPLAATLATQCLIVVVSAGIGWLVLRLRGHYLAIATLSFSIIVEVLIKEWPALTGGMQGMSGIPPYRIGPWRLDDDLKVFLVYWPVVFLVLWFALNIGDSRIGRILRAIREGEPVVDSVGLRSAYYKSLIFVLSSVLAGLGGSLYAHFLGFVTPATGSIMFAIDIIMILALGGFDRLWGALVGVVLITLLNEYALGFADYKRIVLGFGLVAVMLVFPRGLLPGLWDLAQARLVRRSR